MPKCCVLFTDIKKSSMLWEKHPDLMPKALKQHDKQIYTLCKKHNALVVKFIGDAYMIVIHDLYDCIAFCIGLCKVQRNHPIKLGSDFLNVRVGFSYGTPIKKTMKIQGKNLVDYFGHVVNTASRMESKVSDVGGFAFTVINGKTPDDKLIEYLKRQGLQVTTVKFSSSCATKIHRSARLMNCADAGILHGVGPMLVYKCELEV